MKLLKLFITGSLSLMLLFACKDDDEKIIGKWAVDSHTLQAVTSNAVVSQYVSLALETYIDFNASTFNFEPDSTCEITLKILDDGQTYNEHKLRLEYILKDNTVMLCQDLQDDELMLEIPFKFKKKQLVMNIDMAALLESNGTDMDNIIDLGLEAIQLPEVKIEKIGADLTLDRIK